MSMSGEDLERTGLLKTMLDKAEEDLEDTTTLEVVEELEDRIEYMNISDEKKKKYNSLIEEIKKERDEKVQEFLFHQLEKILDEE